MASIFTDILNGRSPGRFVWADDRVFAILTIEPRKPGHVLVIPRIEVDRWSDLDEELAMDIFRVGRLIGLAQRDEWNADRVGLMFEGYRVAHPDYRARSRRVCSSARLVNTTGRRRALGLM